MPDGSVECILGQMQAELVALREMIEHSDKAQTEKLSDVSDRVRAIEDTILSARVSWKAGIAVVMALGVLGNVALTFLHAPLTKLAKSIFSP